MRGIELSADDVLRRSIIQALMCHFELSIESIEIAHLIDFKSYFAPELEALAEMEQAGLLKLEPEWITVLPRGRMLVRVIAMAFDRYLRALNASGFATPRSSEFSVFIEPHKRRGASFAGYWLYRRLSHRSCSAACIASACAAVSLSVLSTQTVQCAGCAISISLCTLPTTSAASAAM